MVLHYFFIALIILEVIRRQTKSFRRTNKNRKQFEDIFPEKIEEEWIVQKSNCVQIVSKRLTDICTQKTNLEKALAKVEKELVVVQKSIDGYEESVNEPDDINKYVNKKNALTATHSETAKQIKQLQEEIKCISKIEDSLERGTRREIITAINRYLEKNKDVVTDFNLIRDIIDRNCDIVEEEIQTQIPVPLYWGLCGTMGGIFVGVIFLVSSGSLGNLLSSFQPPLGVEEGTVAWINAKTHYDTQSTQGILSLFVGIALAMLSSIYGIILTTRNSLKSKDTKVLAEKRKHAFISWLQAELLPKMSNDLSSTLITLGRNLDGFNNTFSSNAELLRQTITEITNATTAQSGVLNSIERLDIAKIAKANVTVYEQLKNCTDDISCLAKDLRDVQNSIKGIGQFMQDGINEYERRNTFIQDASSKVDIAIKEGQNKLTESVLDIFRKYDELLYTLYNGTASKTQEIARKYEEEADKLHGAIVAKLTDFKQLENELKNLVDVKKGIVNLEKATNEQNRKIDSLTNAIRDWAQVKAIGGTTHVEMKMPPAYKGIIVVAGSIITLTGLFFVVLRVLESFGIVL